MKKRIVSLLSVIMILVMMCPTVLAATPTATTSKYIQTYALKSSGKIYGYKDEALKTKATNWIAPGADECWIVTISKNKKAVKISYPLDKGGRSVAWFARSEFTAFDLTKSYDYKQFYQKVTTYRRSDGKQSYGYVAVNDKVYILGKSGNYTQLIYPISGGRWKMGWAKTSDVNNALKIPVSSCSITVANANYTGKAVTPAVTVKYGSTTLKSGTDYTLSWSNNVNVGTGKVTVKGKGNYAGSVTKTFSINGDVVIVASSEITRAAKDAGIKTSSNAYKALERINTTYSKKVTASQRKGVLVFLFEGVGNVTSPTKTHMDAMCVVVKNGKILYINRNSTTIPDDPFAPKKNQGTDMPTLCSGIYTFTTTNHQGKYAALNVSGAKVVRFSSKNKFYASTSNGINVHRRSTDTNAPASATWGEHERVSA